MKKQKKREYKARHNIYLSGNKLSDNKIIIKGNRLNLRWIDNSILIWSDNDTMDILREILESLKQQIQSQETKPIISKKILSRLSEISKQGSSPDTQIQEEKK